VLVISRLLHPTSEARERRITPGLKKTLNQSGFIVSPSFDPAVSYARNRARVALSGIYEPGTFQGKPMVL